jgi:hypothetical protein
MPPNNHLAALEAQALANTRLITTLSHRNSALRTEQEQQDRLIARFHAEMGSLEDLESSRGQDDKFENDSIPPSSRKDNAASFSDVERNPISTSTSTSRQDLDLSTHPFPTSGHVPTLFYITARTAPALRLSFVVQGMGGEAMEFPIRATELAFLLERALERQRWSAENVRYAVLGFLEVGLVRVDRGGVEVGVGRQSR